MTFPILSLPLSRILLSIALMFMAVTSSAAIELPDRRKDQFLTDPGYYLVPAPYSIPGLGDGFIIIGAMTNVRQTHTDLYGFATTGDIKGYGFFGTEIKS